MTSADSLDTIPGLSPELSARLSPEPKQPPLIKCKSFHFPTRTKGSLLPLLVICSLLFSSCHSARLRHQRHRQIPSPGYPRTNNERERPPSYLLLIFNQLQSGEHLKDYPPRSSGSGESMPRSSKDTMYKAILPERIKVKEGQTLVEFPRKSPEKWGEFYQAKAVLTLKDGVNPPQGSTLNFAQYPQYPEILERKRISLRNRYYTFDITNSLWDFLEDEKGARKFGLNFEISKGLALGDLFDMGFDKPFILLQYKVAGSDESSSFEEKEYYQPEEDYEYDFPQEWKRSKRRASPFTSGENRRENYTGNPIFNFSATSNYSLSNSSDFLNSLIRNLSFQMSQNLSTTTTPPSTFFQGQFELEHFMKIVMKLFMENFNRLNASSGAQNSSESKPLVGHELAHNESDLYRVFRYLFHRDDPASPKPFLSPKTLVTRKTPRERQRVSSTRNPPSRSSKASSKPLDVTQPIVTPPPPTKRTPTPNECQLHEYLVNPEDIQQSNIISPNKIHLGYCAGGCPFPLEGNEHLNYTLHSYFMDRIKLAKGVDVPSNFPINSSCVPIQYEETSLILFDSEESSISLVVFKDLSVSACGCR